MDACKTAITCAVRTRIALRVVEGMGMDMPCIEHVVYGEIAITSGAEVPLLVQ